MAEEEGEEGRNWKDECVHYLDCTDKNTYVKTYYTVHFKYVRLIETPLYFNKALMYM